MRTERGIGFLLVVIASGASVQLAIAAESANEHLSLTTQRVAVFKDGYYLAVKHGTAVTNQDGELMLDDVPDEAILGSMWATSSKGKLRAIVASREPTHRTIDKEIPCTQTLEVLQANLGKAARVILHDKSVFQGTIRTVLAELTATAPTMPLLDLFKSDAVSPMQDVVQLFTADPGLSVTEFQLARPVAGALKRATAAPARLKSLDPACAITSSTVSGIAGSQFVLTTDDGDVLLSVSQIASLAIKDMKTTLMRTLTTNETPKRLTFRFAEANQAVDVSLIYFRPGLRWIPTYRVNVSPDVQSKTANLSLQAEFLNEAEDLDDVPIDIVVGVPNFRFRDTPSPLVLEATMRNVLKQSAPALMNQQMLMGQQSSFSNSMFDARSGERNGPGDAQVPADQLNLPAELGAAGAQDLFVYSLPKMKLHKGQRAALPILTADVPYRDVYTWDFHETHQDRPAHSMGNRVNSPTRLSENRVWHQIVLSNTTRVPWTTGPAMIVQGTQPLGQDLLTYASPGAEVRLPITVAVDLRGTFTEEETDRKLNDMQFNGSSYARISKSTQLAISNRKTTSVDVEVSFRTGGRVTEATEKGKITLQPHSPDDWVDYRGVSSVNNSSTVTWKMTVKPGESFSPTAIYHYFILH